MKTDRKEQRPDVLSDGKAESKVRLDDPSLHFRIVSKEPGLAEQNRINYHKDKGYDIATETATRAVMYCKKEEYEARQAENVRRANARLMSQRSEKMDEKGMRVSTEHDTMEVVKGLED